MIKEYIFPRFSYYNKTRFHFLLNVRPARIYNFDDNPNAKEKKIGLFL